MIEFVKSPGKVYAEVNAEVKSIDESITFCSGNGTSTPIQSEHFSVILSLLELFV